MNPACLNTELHPNIQIPLLVDERTASLQGSSKHWVLKTAAVIFPPLPPPIKAAKQKPFPYRKSDRFFREFLAVKSFIRTASGVLCGSETVEDHLVSLQCPVWSCPAAVTLHVPRLPQLVLGKTE